MFRIKRVYARAEPEDGLRVLVDRLWPRGLSKEKAAVDAWCKEIAPSPELRKWFGHDPARWPEFRSRYMNELEEPERAAAFERLRGMEADRNTVTLLFAAREESYNHAALLKELLGDRPPWR